MPMVPMLVCTALAKLLGLSVPASIIGLSSATPLWLSLMVPYIRAGEWLSGMDTLVLDGLAQALSEDFFKVGGVRAACYDGAVGCTIIVAPCAI